MRIPKEIKIGGLTYEVREAKKILGKKRIHGYQDSSKQLIMLKKSLPDEYKEKVFMHEITHALFDFLMWDQNEDTVERLAQSLYMLVKDNPELFGD